jgi:hypothetical protein
MEMLSWPLLLILLLICFLFVSWLAYLVLYFPTMWLFKTKRVRTIRLILSHLTVILTILVLLGSGPSASNDEIAKIEAVGENYQITVTGQRVYMAHDPISLFMNDTHPDSLQIVVPRAEGVINGQEIQRDGYKTLGTLKIDKEKIIVDLYYESSGDEREPLGWNGEYKLKWKSDN